MLGQTSKRAQRYAPDLRKQWTDAERRLWQRLRGEQLGLKFRRQHPYLNYVLDFVCLEHKLVIEIDGSQRMDQRRDVLRDDALRAAGLVVLRVWNNEALAQTDAVIERIVAELLRKKISTEPHPHPRPSP